MNTLPATKPVFVAPTPLATRSQLTSATTTRSEHSFVLVSKAEASNRLAPAAGRGHAPWATRVGPTASAVRPRDFVAEVRARTLKEIDRNGIPVAAYLAAIRTIAARDPLFAKLLEVFEKRQFTFAMDRSPTVRMSIADTGFKNLYETNKSDGVSDQKQRSFIDAQFLGIEPQQHADLPSSLKAKSLYLVPEPEAGIDLAPTVYFQDLNTKAYVGDTWVFDLDAIESSTLFVVGDTYNRALIGGDLVSDYKQFDIDDAAKLSGQSIQDYLLPLDWLMMSIPYYYEQVKSRNAWRFTDVESPAIKARHQNIFDDDSPVPDWVLDRIDLTAPEFDDAWFERFPELAPFRESFFFQPFGNYVEGDCFGDLPVKGKVKALIYRSQPPSAAEAKRLAALGVELIDGRQQTQAAATTNAVCASQVQA